MEEESYERMAHTRNGSMWSGRSLVEEGSKKTVQPSVDKEAETPPTVVPQPFLDHGVHTAYFCHRTAVKNQNVIAYLVGSGQVMRDVQDGNA